MYKIKTSKPEDFLPIAAIDRIAWQDNSHSTFIPDGEHVWRVWCENALMFTAFSDKKIIGAILAFPCLDGSFCVHKVFVLKEFRGKSIGSDLFKHLIKELDKRDANAWITVAPDNPNARKLYANWGFDREVFCKGFYRAEEDRYVLFRDQK